MSTPALKSKTFTGKDATDLEQQLWAWRTGNPDFFEIERHDIETLPPAMHPPDGRHIKKLEGADFVSLRVDYKTKD